MRGRKWKTKRVTVGEVLAWIDSALDVKSFDDVSNHGL